MREALHAVSQIDWFLHRCRVSEEIKAHPPGVASAKLGDPLATSKAEVGPCLECNQCKSLGEMLWTCRRCFMPTLAVVS